MNGSQGNVPPQDGPPYLRHFRPLFSVALVGLTYLIYGRLSGFPFIQFDDDLYVYGNPVVRDGLSLDGVRWAFTAFREHNWIPLTWLSHMADASLFGMRPGAHHMVNVAFHACNGLLLFRILSGMTGESWKSAFVSMLFVVHPMHVESVAWVAERKDVLSTFFLFLTIGSYTRYVRSTRFVDYLWMILSFACGLMSKPMLVTAPFILLLIDWWPLNRFPIYRAEGRGEQVGISGAIPGHLLLEKLPLILLSLISSVLVYFAQDPAGVLLPRESIPFTARMGNAVTSVLAYLAKTAWPVYLAVVYPHPYYLGGGIPVLHVTAAAAVVTAVSLIAFRQRGSRPWFFVGWFFYLAALLPVIGLVQIGKHGMADRYTYVPLVGIFILITWGGRELIGRLHVPRGASAVAAGAILAALSVLARHQVGYWGNSVLLFTHAAEVTQDNWIALGKLGIVHYRNGDLDKSIVAFKGALRIKEDDYYSLNGLGVAYLDLGRCADASVLFRKALSVNPASPKANCNLGAALECEGDFNGAISRFREALRLDPGYAKARIRLEAASRSQGLPAGTSPNPGSPEP